MTNRNFDEWLSKFRPSISSYDYYIDFEKVIKNVDEIKVELNILNSLIGSKNIEDEFEKVVTRYPETLKCIPLLLAVRSNEIYAQDEDGAFLYNFKTMNYAVEQYKVCSQINRDLNARKVIRPTKISIYSYNLKCDEYRQGMTSVIEQILGVITNYYPSEFELLKKLALDGRNAFKKELALGEKGIQHLVGYCIIKKVDGEYFIRIKSIEEYIKNKFVYDSTLNKQKDKRARINIRRDSIEEKLRSIILFSLQSKYGRKAKEQLISIVDKTTTDVTQKTKMLNAPSLKSAIEELYLSQIKIVMEKDWKSYSMIFPDKSKFEAYMDILNRSRTVGAHTRSVSSDDEILYGVAFEFFENSLIEY